jgi:hypothetical protein
VEALALTAVHAKRMGTLLTQAEKAANTLGRPTSKSLVDIVDAMHADEVIRTAQSWIEPNKYDNGALQKASKQLLEHAVQWNVGPGQLKEKMAELINATGEHLNPLERWAY